MLLKIGLLINDGIARKRAEYSETDRFRIIISFDGEDCIIRFHKVRVGEKWIADDIESYSEGLMLLDLSQGYEPAIGISARWRMAPTN